MTTYQVTFRVGGIDATDQHRTATVEAADERGALDAAAARLWGKPDGDHYVGAYMPLRFCPLCGVELATTSPATEAGAP